MRSFALVAILWAGLCGGAAAQPSGWTDIQAITINAQASAVPDGYQLRLVIDTAALVSGGDLQADGGDLRFSATQGGLVFLDHYVASGVNTASTVIFVRTPAIPASGSSVIYMFHGNPIAADTSTSGTFDFVSLAQNTTLGQGAPGALSGSDNSQRGHRFTPTEDLLVTDLGGNLPSAGARPITLFDFATQAILRQASVVMPGNGYEYDPISPILLEQGQTYIISEFNSAAQPDYYFGSGPTPVAKFGYQDMRFCNGCTANTFPTGVLGDLIYGLPDFIFRTRVQLSNPPTYSLGAATVVAAVPFGRDFVVGLACALLLMGAGMVVCRRRQTAGSR
jgi:hypothetical protein